MTTADPTGTFEGDMLAVAHEREAAWCSMRARALLVDAQRHRRSAADLRGYRTGGAR